MNNINYIVVKLCDNDFGGDLSGGLRSLAEKADLKKLNPEIVKKYIIEYVTKENKLRSILLEEDYDEGHMKQYLQKISVEFSRSAPQGIDHDGGSACYDTNRNNVFNF